MAKEKFETVELGDEVQDKVSKLVGVAVGKTRWLYGCVRIGVQPRELTKDGVPADPFSFDEPQLTVLKRGVVPATPAQAFGQDGSADRGDRVKDPITGLSGIVQGVTEWLAGNRRLNVQPEGHKDGAPLPVFSIEAPTAILVKRGVMKVPGEADVPAPAPEAKPKHGPRSDAAWGPAAPRRW